MKAIVRQLANDLVISPILVYRDAGATDNSRVIFPLGTVISGATAFWRDLRARKNGRFCPERLFYQPLPPSTSSYFKSRFILEAPCIVYWAIKRPRGHLWSATFPHLPRSQKRSRIFSMSASTTLRVQHWLKILSAYSYASEYLQV